MVYVLLIYVVGAGLVAAVAAMLGRSGLAWFVIALGVSFILALVFLLVLPLREPPRRLAAAEARDKICLGCGEAARRDARICRSCRGEFREFPSAPPQAWLSSHSGTIARECPQCGLINEPGTVICECGRYIG
ncbi:hypothetical protein MYXO_03069 [Myxococcaceae bacterium]|nr:hypothetical protein MYXO_03069 [Myxococcaceae bacterium]